MLLNDRIEFKGSLLQFKHKTSFMLNDYILDPPIKLFKEHFMQLDPRASHKYHSENNYRLKTAVRKDEELWNLSTWVD